MLLYTATTAPNPRRVAVFIAEKGISVPTRWVSLRDGEHFGSELSAKNPDRALPFVELDDGTVISESVAVCRYLEALHPLRALDAQLAEHEFVVGDAITMADIVAHTSLLFAQRTKLDAAVDLAPFPHLRRWTEAMSARSSAGPDPTP